MNKSYRGANDSDSRSKKVDVNAEVTKLISKAGDGKTDFNLFAQLKGKFGSNDELIEAVFDGYKEKLNMIQKKALKFKQLMHDRYSRYNFTFPQLFKKAKKYKKRYQLTDDEFQIFMQHAMSDKSFGSSVVNLPNTSMAKTLGYGATLATTEKLKVKDNEFDVLQDILKINAETKPLHANVILQTLTYQDCALEAVSGVFKRDVHNAYSYVHPIVAALFLPKVDYIDECMLIASISQIVKLKHEGKPILTKPDYGLYYDLITDPNDTVCDMSSPLKDLRNRIVLQTRLWDAVLNLRQGKYYNDRLVNFLVAIENCRNNIYDVPDLTYVKDEGAILRRLLSAFSFRPTIVSTVPLYGVLSSNPHIGPTTITQVTTIPMVTLRLPLNIYNSYTSIDLRNGLQQAHWFVENKMLVPKSQSIIYSRDVLFFYVGRRFQLVHVGNVSSPYNFNSLPMTVAGMETLNDRPVEFSPTMDIQDEVFQLRSVVLVDTTSFSPTNQNNNRKVITGCSTAVCQYDSSGAAGSGPARVLLYDPQSAVSLYESKKTTGSMVGNRPISTIDYSEARRDEHTQEPIAPLVERAKTRGTIFMYVKDRSSNSVNRLVKQGVGMGRHVGVGTSFE